MHAHPHALDCQIGPISGEVAINCALAASGTSQNHELFTKQQSANIFKSIHICIVLHIAKS